MAQSDQDFWKAYFPEAFEEPGASVEQVAALAPQNLSATELKRWLIDSSRLMSISTTQWAKSAGLAPSTINRFVKGNGPDRLSARTIEILQDFLVREFRSNAFVDFASAGLRQQVRVRVIGDIEEGFRQDFHTSDSSHLSLALPAAYLQYKFYALRVMKNNIDQLRRDDFVIGFPFCAAASNLQDGQRFVFHERDKEDRSYVATTLRRLVVDPNGERWFVRTAKDDTFRALHWTDIGTAGFNDRCLLSLAVVGCVSYDDWAIPNRFAESPLDQ